VIDVPCAGVLFDCDGVLVDSDASVVAAWTWWAREQSLDPDEVVAMVHGRRSADTVALLIEPAGRTAALEQIDAYEIELAQQVRAVPGAQELAASMPGDRWAVVTSGTTPLAQARLLAAGITLPHVVVTADDVRRGKPEPEGYLTAAARLGVPAERTVVLEDAAAGVQAARSAGVRFVIGVGGRGLEEVADTVVADLTGIRWASDGLHIDQGG
jgi:mannitol-1-/sugar-/sorbitol-6-phosphatase